MGDTSQAAPGSGHGGHLVGAIQVVGGVLEVALGVGGVAVPAVVTQVGGVILIAHGTDTIVAGFESMWSGDVHSTYTQRGATAAAKSLHASDQTAKYVGIGADVALGVGPSIAMSISRRVAIAGAERAAAAAAEQAAAAAAEQATAAGVKEVAITGAERGPARVVVAYLNKSALAQGHNAVGIRQGTTTAWYHFAGDDPAKFVRMIPAASAKTGYRLTELTVTTEQVKGAADAARKLVAGNPYVWQHLGPNCATTVRTVLRGAGIVVPEWSRTPLLLHVGVNAGTEITIVGGAAAAAGGALGASHAGRRQSGPH